MNPDINKAKNWYWWLWLSPLLTIPTLIFIWNLELGYSLIGCGINRHAVINAIECDSYTGSMLSIGIGLLGSAFWHLVLLIPALNRESRFVRWHGRQILVLAGIRTLIPISLLFIPGGYGMIIAPLLLIVVWGGGTFWGQMQASRGDCALTRWMGKGAGLPLTVVLEEVLDERAYPLIEGKPDYLRVYKRGQQLDQWSRESASQTFLGLIQSGAPQDLKAKVVDDLQGLYDNGYGLTADMLAAIYRFSRNEVNRQKALIKLMAMGLVETL